MGARGVIRAERPAVVSDDERVAWIALSVGLALAALVDVAFISLDGLTGVLGIAAGYGAWRMLERRTPRGPRGYWRGRPYN